MNNSATVLVPHVRGLPVLGSTLPMARDSLGQIERGYARHGEIFSLNFVGRRWTVLAGPESIGEALANRDRALANGPAWSFLIGPFFKRGIMLLDFDEHLQHRRIMQSAFTRARLVGYLDAMNPVIAECLDSWPSTGRIRGEDAVRQLTLDIATRTFMGSELGPESDQINKAFHDCVKAGTSILRHDVPGLAWSRGLTGRRLLEEFLIPQVASRRESDAEDLLTALCHAESDGDRFTDEDVVNHMIFLLMAAHDTSTSAVSTMLYYLATNPDWQERCRAESQQLGKLGLEYDNVAVLESLDLVFKEALRLVTPVPGIARYAVADTQIMGRRIPQGSHLVLSTAHAHRSADVWTDPTCFDPERFSEARREDKVHRYAYEPFGGGVHKCIGLFFAGMQVKAILHQLLLSYSFACPEGYQMTTNWRGLPTPSQGVPLQIEKLR